MGGKFFNFILVAAVIQLNLPTTYGATIQNRTAHHVKKSVEKEPISSYRSFQPVSIKYHNEVYPKTEHTDYDITSYDTEYGGVVSNFTSSIYDDNPPIYPNPEVVGRGNQDHSMDGQDMDLPDESLADGDLKEHNIIDSVTYLYGFNSCQGVRTEWMILIFIASGISVALLSSTSMWLMWSEHAKEFREGSKLYPLVFNLCCCCEACTLIYIQAIMGLVTPSECEKIALLLHYTHLSCSIWIVLIAATVTEYCTSNTIMSIKYHYLMAYGVPAVLVTFNYALSMEHYETKHYCWMSIEKGMVMGFMVPAMILILLNTGTVIIGLQVVNRKQAEALTAKIQELVDHHVANWPKNEPICVEQDKNGSTDTLGNIYSPGSSRKNTDSSDTLDKDYNYSEDDCNYGNNQDGNCDDGNDLNGTSKHTMSDKVLLNMLYLDNISWKSTLTYEIQQLKTYLNLCLVLEPFFAVNWVMGVVAVENAAYWPTPALYLILLQAMYIYLCATVCTTLPLVRRSPPADCQEVVADQTTPPTRTTDSIPLLDPTVSQPNVTPAPADTISTISI